MRFDLLAGASPAGLAGAFDPNGLEQSLDVRLAQALGTDSRILGLRLRGDPPDEPTGALVAGEIFSPTVDASTRWGVEALDRVRGSFVVLGPAGRGKIFVAADQTGASSVYWRTDNGVLFFASEIRLLLRLLRTRPPVNELAVVHWIANSATPAEQTLYDGVFELPAGELLLLSGDGWERRRYWSVRYREPYASSRQEIVETLWTRLTAAVQMRLENSGTAGILMSGGVDSSAVSAAAVEVSPPGRQPRGYSAVFPGHAHPRVDESERIEALVTGIGLPSTQVEVRPGGAFALSLEWLRTWDLPLTGAGFLLERPLLELASRDGVEAVLDGQGGDEAFALSGYLLADRLLRGRLRSSLGLTRRLPGGDDSPGAACTRRGGTTPSAERSPPHYTNASGAHGTRIGMRPTSSGRTSPAYAWPRTDSGPGNEPTERLRSGGVTRRFSSRRSASTSSSASISGIVQRCSGCGPGRRCSTWTCWSSSSASLPSSSSTRGSTGR